MVVEIVRQIVPKPLRRLGRAWLDSRGLRKLYVRDVADRIFPLVHETGETHNFTYDLSPANLDQLAEMLAVALRQPSQQLAGYIREAMEDRDLDTHLRTTTGSQSRKVSCLLGRRLGWYATVRAIKPKIVVETGVDRGHGSVAICAALLRNADEGFAGLHYGTDINPRAGDILTGKYASRGSILYGDSIQSLRSFGDEIDLFINDSDHSGLYEYEEYITVAPKLSKSAIILSDNAHCTDSLLRFSRERGRKFLFFRESPVNHFYPGAGIGISYL